MATKSTNYQQEIPESGDYVDIDVVGRTIASIDTQVSKNAKTASDASTTLTKNLGIETDRAKKAEQALSSSISDEITRAKNAEAANKKLITDETARAKTAEQANATAISTEATRAKGAEGTLTTNLTTEVNRAKGVEGTRTTGTYIKDTNTLAQNDTALDTQVKKNTDAIGVLNGTGIGSVTKTVSDAVAKVVADAPDNFNTLKEISDWINTHTNSAATMNSQITTNKEGIATLNTNLSSEITRAKKAEGDTTTALSSHKSDKKNPHGVTKAQVGLDLVDNTSDLNKPISNKTQEALNKKANTADLKKVATSGSYTDLTNKPDLSSYLTSVSTKDTPLTEIYMKGDDEAIYVLKVVGGAITVNPYTENPGAEG